MKLWGIFRFELAYQLHRPWPWLFFAVVLVVVVLMTRDSALANAMYEDFFVNAPFAIASTTVFGCLIWLLAAPVVAGEAAARDVATRMHPLVYTAPLAKTDYLAGRFLAALVVNALILLAVPLGFLLAVYSPGVDPDSIAPFRPAAYLTAYGFIALPNALIATAIQFSIAARSGRTMAGYVGSLFLVFMGFFIGGVVLWGQRAGTLVDPIGIRFIVEDLAHDWTTIERRTRLLALEGLLLTNRLLWIGIALATLAVSSVLFRFAHRAETAPRWLRWIRPRRGGTGSATPADSVLAPSTPIRVAPIALDFGFAIHLRKTLAITWESFRTIAKSLPGLALLVAIPLMTVPVIVDQMETAGIAMVPTTARVVAELTAPLSAELSRWVIVPLLLVFFAGELVWREREARMGEIIDAMPGSEWAPLVGKFLGLGLVLVLFMAALTAAGVLAQAIQGHAAFEMGLYLQVLFGLQLPEYLLFALLAIVVHVVVDQKYVGHLVAIMIYVFIAVIATMLGIEHDLLVYGASPGWSYTPMRGFAGSVWPWLWFMLYWAAWALALAVAARLLWTRGRDAGLRVRLGVARGRLAGSTAWVAGASAMLVLTLGGFIFYNTNVLNTYRSSATSAELRAEYERRYAHFAGSPQPRIAGTSLHVEIHPRRRSVDMRGSYRLVNGTTLPIDTILVSPATSGAETRRVTFDRAASLTVDDALHGQRVYVLGRPLSPGDTLTMEFETAVEPRGFRESGSDASVSPGGSYFTAAWFPSVGYQRQRELITAADRREYGLEPRPVIASLYEADAREPASRGGGIAFEAVLGTDTGQVAVAPGALRRTWSEGGRNYFHYVTDAPIGREWAFFSAEYATREARWKDVTIRIFHHPTHTAHLDRTVRSVSASLDYYSAQYGPYPYRHITVVENPAAPGTGLHADASIISHGQGFPFWIPKDAGALDFPYAVMAHEMAHQWTLPYAMVEGAPFLSEGLAWYSAMQVVRASKGENELRRLLANMKQPNPFPPIRRGEPLLRALDPYMSYRRGPLSMFTLSEYIGADGVNAAIRRLVERHDVIGAPLATTLDLYRELRAVTPDSLQPLLRDLFEANTFWELATQQVTAQQVTAQRVAARPLTAPGMTTQQAAAGAWEVTLHVRARKVAYDSAGVRTEVPMNDLVEVAVYADTGQGAAKLRVPVYVQKHRIRTGEGTITVRVSRQPVAAGIDPNHLLDWEERDGDDNIREARIAGPARK